MGRCFNTEIKWQCKAFSGGKGTFSKCILSHFVYPVGLDSYCIHNSSVAKLLILHGVRIIFPRALLNIYHIQLITVQGWPWVTVLQ